MVRRVSQHQQDRSHRYDPRPGGVPIGIAAWCGLILRRCAPPSPMNPPTPAICDARLTPAVRILEDEPIAVLSLDVFDTLLWRRVGEPVDVFHLVGHQLRERGLFDELEPAVFARLRCAAEARARGRHPDPDVPEVTLAEIYEELPERLTQGISLEELVDLEVEVEQSITVVDAEVVSLALLAQQTYAVDVVLASDTYLSSRQLRILLDRPPASALRIREVYTSSERQAGKGNRLFGHILADLAIEPHQVLHVGDHPESDVAAASRHGIHAVHYDKYQGDLKTVLDRETGTREHHIYRRVTPIHHHHGDFGLSALRSRAVARRGPDALDQSVQPYADFGATVLGPVFTGFAQWMHRRAIEEGADVIFCLMREGDFLARVLNGARRALDSPVTARTLWLSRRVCAAAAIAEVSEKSLRAFLNRRRPPTVGQFLTSLGLPRSTDRLEPFAPRMMDDPEVQEIVIEALLADEGAGETILAHATEARRRLVGHFERTVGTDAGQVLVADLGWSATIQANLDRALELSGTPITTLGLYLVTTEGSVDHMLAGTRSEGFLGTGGEPEPVARWVTRCPELLEQICMCDAGSLIGIEADGTLVHDTTSQAPLQQLQRNAVQRGITTFQELWHTYVQHCGANAPDLSRDARDLLQAMILRLIVEPTPHEATLFGGWAHDENFGSTEEEAIASPDLAPLLGHMTPQHLLGIPMTRLYWPFGLAALHDPDLQVAARAVTTAAVPHTAFSSARVLPLFVEQDDGAEFIPVVEAHMRGNRNGQAFFQHALGGPVRGIRFRFDSGSCVVRIDSLRLAFSRGHPLNDVHVAAFAGPAAFAEVRVDSGVALAPNVFVGDAPAIGFSYPDAWPDSYRVDIELAYAVLPLPPLDGRPTRSPREPLRRRRR